MFYGDRYIYVHYTANKMFLIVYFYMSLFTLLFLFLHHGFGLNVHCVEILQSTCELVHLFD